jgi:hypothetical protein
MPDDRTAKKEVKKPKPLPAPNTDFYYLYETLPAAINNSRNIRIFFRKRSIAKPYWSSALAVSPR